MRTAEAASWIATAPWRVERVRRESHDVVTLALVPPEPFTFEPGQFSMLYLAGVGEVPISISGTSEPDGLVLHTIRDVGAVTHALCTLIPGQHVGVRGPYGTAWPVAAARGGDLVVVAGGIGLPPLRPAIRAALAERDKFGHIVLLYGARTPADLLFTDELTAWRGRFDLTVEVTVDAADSQWRGNVGVVPDLIARAGPFDPGLTTVFTVGPEIMMRFAVRALLGSGVAPERIYLSMERNMQCAAALCGHCQFGPFLICRDGPVLSYQRLARWLGMREV
ncbi:MAG TPA: FAD/NAD(P)-binding protein [Streptosporangiaceae bacterium]|nr:FAD/NAD(P)-binding protein [Streptosporangiaceae bacterium]